MLQCRTNDRAIAFQLLTSYSQRIIWGAPLPQQNAWGDPARRDPGEWPISNWLQTQLQHAALLIDIAIAGPAEQSPEATTGRFWTALHVKHPVQLWRHKTLFTAVDAITARC
jgi:hypothetical protein